jgi:hypothetical protein
MKHFEEHSDTANTSFTEMDEIISFSYSTENGKEINFRKNIETQEVEATITIKDKTVLLREGKLYFITPQGEVECDDLYKKSGLLTEMTKDQYNNLSLKVQIQRMISDIDFTSKQMSLPKGYRTNPTCLDNKSDLTYENVCKAYLGGIESTFDRHHYFFTQKPNIENILAETDGCFTAIEDRPSNWHDSVATSITLHCPSGEFKYLNNTLSINGRQILIATSEMAIFVDKNINFKYLIINSRTRGNELKILQSDMPIEVGTSLHKELFKLTNASSTQSNEILSLPKLISLRLMELMLRGNQKDLKLKAEEFIQSVKAIDFSQIDMNPNS